MRSHPCDGKHPPQVPSASLRAGSSTRCARSEGQQGWDSRLVGFRAIPAPQKRGTWGTQIFAWGGGLPGGLRFAGEGAAMRRLRVCAQSGTHTGDSDLRVEPFSRPESEVL
jgi:hypothetical protein